jgi:RNA polymerase sigma-70 factor (ECF subfamily)
VLDPSAVHPCPSPGPVLPAARAREVDAETIALCKAGDHSAFTRFVKHYEHAVMALVSRILGPVSDIEDVAQEVFLRAFRALPRFDLNGPATVTTWLLTIATRLALNDKRRLQQPYGRASSVEDVDVPDGNTPEQSQRSAELGRAIEAAAGQLPIDQRVAFVLAEFHAMTMAEIGAALEIPENTAKTRVFRAREKMREILLPHWGGT